MDDQLKTLLEVSESAKLAKDLERLNGETARLRDEPNGNGGQPQDLTLSALVTEIKETILKYVELERPELAALVALWLVQSYSIEVFAFSGFMHLQSASPRCGKSRLLEVMGVFTRYPTPLRTMPTPAVLYRTNDKTLFLDEIEGLRNSDKERFGEVMALLNMGFKRGGVVERCEKTKKGWVVVKYGAYRAYAFAGISTLSDTLADRSFQVQLRRTNRKMPRLNIGKLEVEMQPIRDGLAMWWAKNSDIVQELYEGLPDEPKELRGLDDRLMDITEPLLTLARCADAESGDDLKPIMTEFRKALAVVKKRREPSGIEENILSFIEMVTPRLANIQEMFFPSHELVDMCRDTEGLEWIENPRRLKGFLKKFDMFPKNQGGKVRGYSISTEWVHEWSQRYLSSTEKEAAS